MLPKEHSCQCVSPLTAKVSYSVLAVFSRENFFGGLTNSTFLSVEAINHVYADKIKKQSNNKRDDPRCRADMSHVFEKGGAQNGFSIPFASAAGM